MFWKMLCFHYFCHLCTFDCFWLLWQPSLPSLNFLPDLAVGSAVTLATVAVITNMLLVAMLG